MVDVLQVEPKSESYVLEWRAAQVDRSGMGEVTRLLRQIGASVFADLADLSGCVVIAVRPGVNLRAAPGDWIVVSPHDKVMVLDYETFMAEFSVVA